MGRVGSDLYLLGTSFLGPVASAGVLELFYWDTFTPDNSGFVTVGVQVIPEPSAGLLTLMGLTLLGMWARRPKGRS